MSTPFPPSSNFQLGLPPSPLLNILHSPWLVLVLWNIYLPLPPPPPLNILYSSWLMLVLLNIHFTPPLSPPPLSLVSPMTGIGFEIFISPSSPPSASVFPPMTSMILWNVYLMLVVSFQQQMQAQHLPHAHAPPIPMPPHPGLQPPGLPPTSSAGLLALPGGLSAHLPSASLKEDKRDCKYSSWFLYSRFLFPGSNPGWGK